MNSKHHCSNRLGLPYGVNDSVGRETKLGRVCVCVCEDDTSSFSVLRRRSPLSVFSQPTSSWCCLSESAKTRVELINIVQLLLYSKGI